MSSTYAWCIGSWVAAHNMKTNNGPRKWQKTEIVWDNTIIGLGWKTNIPVDEFKDSFHQILNTRAVSIPGIGSDEESSRTAIITFDVIRGVIGPTTRRDEILKRIQEVSPDNTRASCSWIGSEFKINLSLRRSFCDEVIEFMKLFFEKMGITDSVKYRLQNFQITTQTYFRQGQGYIPFAQQLKLDHGIHMGEELDVEMMPDTKSLA